MKIPQMIAAELRRLTSTRMSVIALLALVAVPVLYGGLYLWANQDPYAKLPEVPVALVVADDGTSPADGSEPRNIGDEIADEVIADGAFDWHRVSADEAAAGLDESRYDFAITFPADFSQALASVQTETPRQAEIVLATNDANSYLAGTIGTQAVERIRVTIAEQVGEEAASSLLDSISTIRGKLGEAADGAAQLTDGAATAVDGAVELGSGATRLADGNAQLATGTAQLATGSAQLADGARRVAAGNAELAASADRVGAAVGEAAAALPQVRSDITERLTAAGVDDATIDAVLARLDPIDDELVAGNDRGAAGRGADRPARGGQRTGRRRCHDPRRGGAEHRRRRDGCGRGRPGVARRRRHTRGRARQPARWRGHPARRPRRRRHRDPRLRPGDPRRAGVDRRRPDRARDDLGRAGGQLRRRPRTRSSRPSRAGSASTPCSSS